MPARVMKEFQAPRGLPRKTASVCPECIKVIPAVVREKDGRVIMEKTCRTHGYFWDIISNDVDFYLRMEVYAHDGVGYENPYYDKFMRLPDHLRHVQPPQVPHRTRPDRPDEPLQPEVPGLLRERQRRGVRLRADPRADPLHAEDPPGAEAGRARSPSSSRAGNRRSHRSSWTRSGWPATSASSRSRSPRTGSGSPNEPGFAQACRDNGLHTLYLQFDGLDDEIYRKVRGVPLLKVKQKAIQAARETHSPASDLAAGKARQAPLHRAGPDAGRRVQREGDLADGQVRDRQHRRRPRRQLPAGRAHGPDPRQGPLPDAVHPVGPGPDPLHGGTVRKVGLLPRAVGRSRSRSSPRSSTARRR